MDTTTGTTSTTSQAEVGGGVVPESSNDVVVQSPSTSNTQLPAAGKRDSASSFVTAHSLPYTTANNSSSNNNTTTSTSSTTAAATHVSRRDTMGSLSMARIAEESPSSGASTPSVTRLSMGLQLDESSTGSSSNNNDTATTPTAAAIQSPSPSQSSLPPPALSSRLSSSSSLASSSGSTSKRKEEQEVATARSIGDRSASRDSLHPIQTTTSPSSDSPAAAITSSSSATSRSPRTPQHSTLAATTTNAESSSLSTRSIHSASSQHSPSLPTTLITDTAHLSPAAAAPSNGEATSTASSSTTPRLNTATMSSRSNSKSSIGGGDIQLQHNDMREVFKIPLSASPSSSPVLQPINGTPAYPPAQSHSSPNLQQQQSSPQQEESGNNVAGVGTGEALLRAPARYSHAGFFNNTHPPTTVSGNNNAQYAVAAAMHSQRSSAPILAPSLSSNSYGYPAANSSSKISSSASPQQQHPSELPFVPSPRNGLSDAGFGSSSPYPPIGAQQQQRYSLPVQSSTAIPTFAQPFPSSAASLRPQPTTSYNTPGQSKHLPEMHPSALEARPSISAPFPPSSSPPRGLKVAAPAAMQQRERPDASRPLGQEICLECLMRDRDMIDVEVTGPGVWSRNSDIDFEEALRAEEIAIANAAAHGTTNGGHNTGSSAEDGNELDRRSYALHRNGSTEENYGVPLPPSQNGGGGRYTARDGGPIRSPSRESSVSDGQRGYRRQNMPPRRRLGRHDPLTSASLKLWTQMNHVSSAHRYKVLSDYVQEQTRHLDQERKAYEQSVVDRDRADRAIRDSPAKMSLETRSSFSSGIAAGGASGVVSPKMLDLRRGTSKTRVPSMQLLPNGMTVETIDVQWDEKEAKARAKAAHKSRRASTHSPNENRKSFAPSVKSFNALSTYNSRTEAVPSPTGGGSFAPPWMADERRRFSSPMLSSKYRNASSDNLSRNRQYAESGQDLRKSSYSMMSPPLRAMRSPSPSRQSFQTGTSQRESRGWRRSLWPRSASASVASFPRSGSMMEMHLGMSQDKHEPMPSGYPHDYSNPGLAGMHAPGGTWPDNASELGEQGGISADENVEAAKTKKQKKKRFQKLFNSLLGTHHTSEKVDAKRGPAAEGAVDQYASQTRQHVQERDDGQQRQYQQSQRRQNSVYAAAAYQDDYSEPLAPPPPLSYLTGQQPHNRSYSTSSQSSVNPPGSASQYQDANGPNQANNRPTSLAVPRNLTNSSNGFVSPSTSSSDLNRNRPSSVTSWRSSSNKTNGSPQSPRELLADNFGHPLPAIRQASFEELAPGLHVVPGMEMMKDHHATDVYKLRKEKSLPALPPGEYDGMHSPIPGQDYALQHQLPNVSYDQAQFRPPASYGPPPVHPIGMSVHEIYGSPNEQYGQQFPSNGSEWDYNSPVPNNDYEGGNSTVKGNKKPKMRSRLFSFGAKKSRSSTSPPPTQVMSPAGQQAAYSPKGFAPHEAALQAVVRDQGDMIAYRYPSAPTHA